MYLFYINSVAIYISLLFLHFPCVFGTFLCCSVHISNEQLSLLQCGLPFAALPLSLPAPQSFPLPRAAFSPGLPALVASSSLPPVKCTSVSKTGETSINLSYTGSSPVVEAREGQSRASTGAQEVLPLTCLSWCERRSHSFSVGSAPNKVNC